LNQFRSRIREITLVPSDGGRFEVSLNDELVYSKLQTGRHADPAEVLAAVGKLLTKENV